MAYKGLTSTFRTVGNFDRQVLFRLYNPPNSKVLVVPRRLSVQLDTSTAVLLTDMPLIRVSRFLMYPDPGYLLPKGTLDTLESSDPMVQCIGAASADGVADPIEERARTWQQYSMRNATGAGAVLGVDNSMLPNLVEETRCVVRPGERLQVEVIEGEINSNPATNHWIVQCVWDEEARTGLDAISGLVTLSASPVSGAKVCIIIADDQLMTNPMFWEVVTTNAQGQWSSAIPSTKVGAAFAQHKNGATLYTAPARPFLD